MANITNNYEAGSCTFEAGSSQNGDVHITGGTFSQGRAAAAAVNYPADEAAEPVAQLTTQQLVMLFETLLDISLDASFTNQSELAELLAKVSGYKKEGVRVKISRGLDYEKPQARKDAELLAALLDKIRPDLAQKLRNGAQE